MYRSVLCAMSAVVLLSGAAQAQLSYVEQSIYGMD